MDIPGDLVRAAQQGDRAALEDLIERSYRPAFTLALRLMGNRDDAAEATQEAFVRVVKGLKGFREVGAYPTWMYRIVSNVCMSEMRKRYKRETPVDMEVMVDPNPVDAEEIAIDRVFKAEVDDALKRLPESYRTIIVLRDVYGLSGEETGEILGISDGAVKVRLHRARKRMRDDLMSKFPGWGTGGGTELESA